MTLYLQQFVLCTCTRIDISPWNTEKLVSILGSLLFIKLDHTQCVKRNLVNKIYLEYKINQIIKEIIYFGLIHVIIFRVMAYHRWRRSGFFFLRYYIPSCWNSLLLVRSYKECQISYVFVLPYLCIVLFYLTTTHIRCVYAWYKKDTFLDSLGYIKTLSLCILIALLLFYVPWLWANLVDDSINWMK